MIDEEDELELPGGEELRRVQLACDMGKMVTMLDAD
jgi:hypothetical protein